jgi:hypothetical protein
MSSTKIESLLAKRKINAQDIESFSKLELEHLEEIITNTLLKLKGEERDAFLYKIDAIVTPDTKSDIWEYNHTAINGAISNYMERYGRMPTKNAIAQKTGLSRQTVTKHMAAYKQQPEYSAEKEQFKFMSHKMLANVFKYAINGDIRAAKLYFEMIGEIDKQQAHTVVNEQTNYIQINNTILSQENLKQLSAEQLNQIESIVMNKQKVLA